MKNIAVIVLLIAGTDLSAQNHSAARDMPRYKIELTTENDNVLKGLLLEVKDSSILIYPGKRKDWRRKTFYKPVEFGYSNIKQIALENKNRALKGILVVGAIVDSKGRKVFHINGSEPVFNEFKKIMQ